MNAGLIVFMRHKASKLRKGYRHKKVLVGHVVRWMAPRQENTRHV